MKSKLTVNFEGLGLGLESSVCFQESPLMTPLSLSSFRSPLQPPALPGTFSVATSKSSSRMHYCSSLSRPCSFAVQSPNAWSSSLLRSLKSLILFQVTSLRLYEVTYVEEDLSCTSIAKSTTGPTSQHVQTIYPIHPCLKFMCGQLEGVVCSLETATAYILKRYNINQ